MKLLLPLFLLFSLSTSAQIFKLKAIKVYVSTDNNVVKEYPADLLIVINYDHDRVTVFTSHQQTFDLVSYDSLSENTTFGYTAYYMTANDENGDPCLMELDIWYDHKTVGVCVYNNSGLVEYLSRKIPNL
jgi:hypothetical protein